MCLLGLMSHIVTMLPMFHVAFWALCAHISGTYPKLRGGVPGELFTDMSLLSVAACRWGLEVGVGVVLNSSPLCVFTQGPSLKLIY